MSDLPSQPRWSLWLLLVGNGLLTVWWGALLALVLWFLGTFFVSLLAS